MKLNYRTTLTAALFAALTTLSAPTTSELSTTADILDAYSGAYVGAYVGAGQGIVIATNDDSTVEVILMGVKDDPNTLCATFNGMVDTITLYDGGLFTPVECN